MTSPFVIPTIGAGGYGGYPGYPGPTSFGGIASAPGGAFTFNLTGPISTSSPSGGIFNDGGAACTFLKLLGKPCTLDGARQAVTEGLAVFSGGSGTDVSQGPCVPPAVVIGNKCVDPTAALPGGDPFITTAGGVAVVGAFGLPAIQPMIAGQVQRADGGVSPIRRCPTGMVLGKDELCYPKGSLPRKFRKWAPDPRPPVSAADAKAIRQAESAKGRVKKLASNVGFSCKKK